MLHIPQVRSSKKGPQRSTIRRALLRLGKEGRRTVESGNHSGAKRSVARIYVMDAGSSATRINEVALDKRGCFSQTTVLTYGPLTHLIDFLRHKDAASPVLVSFLVAFIKNVLSQLRHKNASVFLGLTGGIRARVDEEGYQKVLHALVEALNRIDNPRLHFGTPTMAPAEECRLEQLAVRTLNPLLDGHIGMGGASIQVSRGKQCTSIPISTGTPLTEDFKTWKKSKAEFLVALDHYLDSPAAALQQVVGRSPNARYGGTETIGFVAKAAGIKKNSPLSIRGWIDALEPLTRDATLEDNNLRNYVSCLIVFHLLSRFPPEAQLEHFEYVQSSCPQSEIEPTWSIGALEDIAVRGNKLTRNRGK